MLPSRLFQTKSPACLYILMYQPPLNLTFISPFFTFLQSDYPEIKQNHLHTKNSSETSNFHSIKPKISFREKGLVLPHYFLPPQNSSPSCNLFFFVHRFMIHIFSKVPKLLNQDVGIFLSQSLNQVSSEMSTLKKFFSC